LLRFILLYLSLAQPVADMVQAFADLAQLLFGFELDLRRLLIFYGANS
jgi:hypothetical protein